MRLLAGIVVLATLSGVARADDEPRVPPVRPFSAGVALIGHGGAINGVSEGGVGPAVELAFGSGRTHYILVGGLSWVTLGKVETGKQGRVAAGARWVARSFDLSEASALELVLEAFFGAHKFWMDSGNELVRPEFTFGFGLQVRHHRGFPFSGRMGFAGYYAPARDDTQFTARCTGNCGGMLGTADGGLLITFGFMY